MGELGLVDPTRETFEAWSALALSERVVPLFARVVSSTASLLDDDQRDLLTELQLDVAATAVRIEHILLDVTHSLQNHGIRFAVLKGVATAHLDYDDPSLRQFGDADLLVAEDDLRRTWTLLEQAGWTQAYSLPHHHDVHTHAVTFKHPATFVEVDLHQHVAHRALGLLIPPDELLDCTVSFSIARRELRALNEVDRLIHASVHWISSRGQYRRLSSSADVLLLVEKLAVRAPEVLDRSDRWRIRPLVEAAVVQVHAQAALPVPEPWSEATNKPIRHRAALVERAYLGDRRRLLAEELAHLRYMRSLRARFNYVAGHLQPAPHDRTVRLGPRLRYLRSRLRKH